MANGDRPLDPGCIPLRDYFERLLEEHEARHILINEAMELARSTFLVRLESMNEFRAQLDRQQGNFVTREYLEALRQANENRLQKLELAKARMDGTAMIITGVIAGIVALLVAFLPQLR